jgi:SAM-dependent methyltransferase
MTDREPNYLHRANQTAELAWNYEGPGTGAGGAGIDYLKQLYNVDVPNNAYALEIGYGQGVMVKRLIEQYQANVIALDINKMAKEWIDKWAIEHNVPILDAWPTRGDDGYWRNADGNIIQFPSLYARLTDICFYRLDSDNVQENLVDFAFASEVYEHITNPHNMTAIVKHLLKHGGLYVVSFPRPEDNFGYTGGLHGHIYPGFLQRDSYEIFMRQMYFKKVAHLNNGSSAWYVFKNYKGEGMVDAHVMANRDFTEEELFNCMEGF